MNARRLAAIDMYGTQGTTRRRRIILVEFLAGAVAMVAFGVWALMSSDRLGARLLAVWLIGAASNYAILAAHAIALSPAGALDAELSGVDNARELRRCSVLQLWVVVPFSLLAFAAWDTVSQGRSADQG